MNSEILRQKFHRNAMKFEFPTDKYVFSVMLHWNHTANKLIPVLERHYHIRYEVRCLWEPKDDSIEASFLVVPPFVWHTGDFPGERQGKHMTAFQFYVRTREPRNETGMSLPGTALETFLKLQEQVELSDAFGGSRLLREISHEVEKADKANYELLHAKFYLLMVELAQALPQYVPQKTQNQRYDTKDFYPEIIEQFFNENYRNPDCSREQLAQLLCLSPSQVSRIVERMYRKSFREVLTEVRMEHAKASLLKYDLTAERVAADVGYMSTRGFIDAYKQYFGDASDWRKKRK